MSRTDAREREPRVIYQDCARCGSVVNVESLSVAPAGDDVCWSCLRPEEKQAIMKELTC